ncbi:MAG: glycosyltransferase family 2 protein, partial [Acidobacteriota bacterium]
NRPQLLLETVQSVLKNIDLPGEIVIIDDSETPNVELAAMKDLGPCFVRYIWSNSIGLSRARNEGMRIASHEILAFIDDDMQVPSTWYRALIHAVVQAGRKSVVAGRVLPGPNENPGSFVPPPETSDIPHIYEGRIGTDVLASLHMAMYRSAFEEVGGFDERLGPGTRFPSAEDNDYGFRFLEAGYRIVYAPEAMIYHRAWRGRNDYFPLRWAYGRGKGGYYTKYLSLKDSYMLRRMCWDIGFRLLRFPWRLLHRPQLALGDLVYVCGILSGAAEWVWTGRGKQPFARIPERTQGA